MSRPDDNTTGLKKLMEAEEKAKEIIERAKAEKVQKIAQAREDAKQRVSEMKQQKDEEFQQYLQTHNTDLDAQTQLLKEQTKEKIDVIERDFNEHKNEAVEILTAIVLNVQN